MLLQLVYLNKLFVRFLYDERMISIMTSCDSKRYINWFLLRELKTWFLLVLLLLVYALCTVSLTLFNSYTKGIFGDMPIIILTLHTCRGILKLLNTIRELSTQI